VIDPLDVLGPVGLAAGMFAFLAMWLYSRHPPPGDKTKARRRSSGGRPSDEGIRVQRADPDEAVTVPPKAQKPEQKREAQAGGPDIER
jgi:hypothetical protein